uniref:Uncharacterized protein n=1 Tax=Panagrolaimus davidi TaxID=227884 RepID=A0A914PFS4_9BILA
MSNILKLQNLQNLQNLKHFLMLDCPDTLNVEDLSAFMKKIEITKIFLAFDSNISEEYKEKLDSLINEIIESGVTNHYIRYDGQDEEKHRILISRFGVYGDLSTDDEDDLEDNDGFDGENEPVVEETESDAQSTCCIAILFNKIKNFFM